MEIIEKDTFLITGFEIQATFSQLWEKMPEAWNKLFEKSEDIPARKTNAFMDVSFGKNHYGIYTQFIGAEVRERKDKTPIGFRTLEIPGKTYLHFKHEGTLKQIADSFGKMYNWAEKENLKTGEFKLDIGYTFSGDEKHHDLYIEIVK